MADTIKSVSGTNDPYAPTYYTAQPNDKNTLTVTDFFQLLATQLQYQDPTSPMDNSELMNQMTQMAMMQSMTSMTDAIEASTATSAQTYAGSLVGQEVTVAVVKENSYGQEEPTGVKYARVEYVNFTKGEPVFKVEGADEEHPLSHLVGVGKVPDPYNKEIENNQDESEGNGEEGPGGSGEEGPGGVEGPGTV